MNTKTQIQPASIDEAIYGHSAVIVPTIKLITKVWCEETQGAFASDGGNDNSNELSRVALRLIDNYGEKPFNLSDFVLLAGYLDLSRDTVVEFFNSWTEFLTKANRLQVIKAKDSAYEWDSYYFLT